MKAPALTFSLEEIANSIDHALLVPTLTEAELEAGCHEARLRGVASVCTMPFFVRRCAQILAGSAVKTSTTIGFPHGGQTTAVKFAEAARALEDGAEELDMVVNLSKARSGLWSYVGDEIAAVLAITRGRGRKLKVIFETSALDDPQKIKLCEICGEIGVDWVKTSTGFGAGGAADEDLRLMRAHSPAHVQIKASGGVRTLARLLEVRALGATRVGTSSSFAILDECRRVLGLDPEPSEGRTSPPDR